MDKAAKALKEASFPWCFDMDIIKKTARICPAWSGGSANPHLQTGQVLQGEAEISAGVVEVYCH